MSVADACYLSPAEGFLRVRAPKCVRPSDDASRHTYLALRARFVFIASYARPRVYRLKGLTHVLSLDSTTHTSSNVLVWAAIRSSLVARLNSSCSNHGYHSGARNRRTVEYQTQSSGPTQVRRWEWQPPSQLPFGEGFGQNLSDHHTQVCYGSASLRPRAAS